MPIIGILALLITEVEEFFPIFIMVAIGQILMIRFLFIGLAFKFLSRSSLNKLCDVLDVEWINNQH